MNNWWYVVIGAAVLLIISIIAIKKFDEYDYEGLCYVSVATTFVSALAVLVISIVVPVSEYRSRKELHNFMTQKAYIEEVVPTLPEVDNYAITLKRMELNAWLIDAQYSVNKFGNWSAMPKEVMELELIK